MIAEQPLAFVHLQLTANGKMLQTWTVVARLGNRVGDIVARQHCD
jgi:hypothetical protein